MKAVVLIPFRPTDDARERNGTFVCQWWREHGWPYFIGDSANEFDRGRALNIAAEGVEDWDVALITDADAVLEGVQQAEAAMMRCYRTGAYTVAYSHLRYLTEEGTNYVMDGGPVADADYDETAAFTWELVFCVRRDVWDEVGGFDARFRGYGGQGIAFYYAASTLGGRERINGTVYHLAHQLVDRGQESHFVENMNLVARYTAAVDNPVEMRKLLAER